MHCRHQAIEDTERENPTEPLKHGAGDGVRESRAVLCTHGWKIAPDLAEATGTIFVANLDEDRGPIAHDSE
jgi:hypothetical protein